MGVLSCAFSAGPPTWLLLLLRAARRAPRWMLAPRWLLAPPPYLAARRLRAHGSLPVDDCVYDPTARRRERGLTRSWKHFFAGKCFFWHNTVAIWIGKYLIFSTTCESAACRPPDLAGTFILKQFKINSIYGYFCVPV